MIKGLEVFREAFREYSDSYILIGGAACNINLEQAAIPFRTTHDLDIVLCVESLTPEFGRMFWRFIRSGGYQVQERSTGEKKFYRFRKPTAPDYPEMLELFSRQPDNFEMPQDAQLTPIPMDEEVSSLSAILLDGEYYQFILNNRIVVDDISLLSAEALIVLKAKAWLDLSARKEAGEHVDSKDIRKHKNDVFRLWASTSRETAVTIPAGIREDMHRFLALLEDEEVDLSSLRIDIPKTAVLGSLRSMFGL